MDKILPYIQKTMLFLFMMLCLVVFLMCMGVIPVERTNYGKVAWFQYCAGDNINAKRSMKRHLLFHRKSGYSWSMYGLIHLSLRDTLNGERYLEKAFQLNPESSLVLFRLGKFENQRGNYTRGNQLIRKAIDLEPSKKNSYGKYIVFVE